MKQQVLKWTEKWGSGNPLLLCISFFLFALVVIKLKKDGSSCKKKMRLPPSPRKLPLIGNLHQLRGLPHHTLWALSQKYGPVMLLHLGRVPTLVVSSADAARDVLKTYDHIFSSRPQFRFPTRLLYGKDVLFAPYGEYWRQGRKVCVLQLLSAKKVQSFRFVREQEVALMMETIRASSSVNMGALFVGYSNSVVCRIVIGPKYNKQEGEREDGRESLKATLEELSYLIGVQNVADFIPSLAWVNHLNGLNARFEKNFKELDSIFEEIVQEHMEKRRGGDVGNRNQAQEEEEEEEDFVDVMLRIAKDKTYGLELDRDNIKAIIMDMITAATDTSAIVMEWAMSELMANPEIMEKVQKEVRGISEGKQLVTEPDIEGMHYLKLVVKETLRMHPPAPLLAPHLSMERVQIQGYDIPLNTIVLINAYAIGRDPKLWDEPQFFRPNRFSNNAPAIDYKGNDFQFIPFGAGRRGCPGMIFAISQIELALANILNSFDWEFPDGMSIEDLDMQERHGFTVSRKNDLILCAKPR